MNKAVRIAISSQDEQGPARFTRYEFLRMSETGAFDDMKIELIEGVLERMNPPLSDHGFYQLKIALLLGTVVTREFLSAETGIDLGNDTIVGCDAAVLRNRPTENRLLTPADVLLAIEVAVSTVGRDLGRKKAAYAKAEIAHYWVVDPQRQVVHSFAEPVQGDYVLVRSYRFGEPLPVPGTEQTIVLD